MSGRIRLAWLVCLCLLALLSTLLPASALAGNDKQASDVAALKQRMDQWLQGYNSADVSRMMEVYADDFSQEVPGAPGLTCKHELARRLTGLFSRYDTHIVSVIDEAYVSGDMAFDRGHYTVSYTPKGGGPTLTAKGRYLEIWKRSDGVWRVYHVVETPDQERNGPITAM
jgi:uncharacterized protein (TIGR02246 family)